MKWKNIVRMLRRGGSVRQLPAVRYSRTVFVYTSQDDTDEDGDSFAVSVDDIVRGMPEPVWLYRLNETPDDEVRPRWALILMHGDGEAQAREAFEKGLSVLAHEFRDEVLEARSTEEDA